MAFVIRVPEKELLKPLSVWSLVMAKSRNEVCHGVSQEDRPHKNKKWSMKEKVNTVNTLEI